jgi:phosphatidylglycerophosphate synthase
MNKDNPPLPEERAYRKQYEATFAPLGRKIASWGISANFVSYLNLIFSILTALSFYLSSSNNYLFIYLALIFLFFASFFDMIDGSVARAHKELHPEAPTSKFGAVLDPAIDRYSEAFIIVGIMFSGYVPPEIVFFTFVGMIMASYVRAKAESLHDGSFSVGIERKEKITLIVIGSLMQALFIHLTELNIFDFGGFYIPYRSNLGVFDIGPLAIFVFIVGILSHISTYQRLKLASKHL